MPKLYIGTASTSIRRRQLGHQTIRHRHQRLLLERCATQPA